MKNIGQSVLDKRPVKMRKEIFCLFLGLTLGNGLSISSSEEVKTKEDIKKIVQLRVEADRKSEGEIEVEFDRFEGGICFLDEHCAFLVICNKTVQISYCDHSEGKVYVNQREKVDWNSCRTGARV